MLAELLEQNHRQEARSRPSARDHVEWRRRLADLLAVPAGELLSDGLDYLPLTGDHLQGLGHVLAQLAQPSAAAAVARRRRIDHHPLARQMVWEGVALDRSPTREAGHGRGLGHSHLSRNLVFGNGGFRFLQLKFHLVDQPRRSFGAWAIDLPLKLGDPQFLVGD
jgi:hypothetical protein